MSCHSENNVQPASIHFTSLASRQTGIAFNNSITESDSLNLLVNEYAYMGGGAGIADFNNDGLQDIFLAANQASSRLYINKGNMQFEDMTEKAGLLTNSWCTGISIVDINNDGYDDIYVCVSGNKNAGKRKNLLYINNGNLTFTEEAAAYGLADTSFSTQAVFFDYDKDGDLDMYLLNHLLYNPNSNLIVPRDFSGKSPATDKLYRNDGVPEGGTHPLFKDVSLTAGIADNGYGLGVVVSDFNSDGWPDLYVANDYIENDNLWLNNRNGTFSNCIKSSMPHQSYSSMGVDAADINNDAMPDIISLDMQPETNERKKMMFSFLTYERYEMERRQGYEPAFMRNMLQLNNGVRDVHDTLQPFFSEIGQFADVQETDWSWSVLMADYDNDGYKDIHITNGFGRDILNSDYIVYRATITTGQTTYQIATTRALMKALDEYGSRSPANYCFHNNGDLTFTNVSAAAGINRPSLSNGCAYADLDNDGDLDLVVNNINQEAFVLRNDARQNKADTTDNFISFILKGDSLNKAGIGANIKIFSDGGVQFLEEYPVRGYASTVDKRLHAGLGKSGFIDSVIVTWPDQAQQVIKDVAANQFMLLDKKNAGQKINPSPLLPSPLFTDVTDDKQIDFRHSDNFFYDYRFQRLLPQKYSQSGPFIATADVNADGLTDFFVGGAFQQSGKIFIQQSNGTFTGKDLEASSKQQEDMGSIFFDADGDGDADLLVNSGSIEFEPGSSNYHPRLYTNDGKGNYTLNAAAIPQSVNTSAQAVTAADYDGDGDLDLFIGGRVSVDQYPVSPRSYILQNNGGRFSDVTTAICDALAEPGMVTDAIWTDFNNDKKPDLIIVGEWMPVRFFENIGERLKEVTQRTGLENMNGFWRSICAVDIDKDGDLDYVVGNLGLNNKYKADASHPVKIFTRDIDGNGSNDPIIAYYIVNDKGGRQLYPAISRDQLAEQVPSVKKQYLSYSDYSVKTMDELFTDVHKNDATVLTCEETRTCWLENKGNGKFVKHVLPVEAQLSPVNSILCTDVDADGNIDIIMAGNEYQTEVSTGRYDASYGVVLKGDGKGGLTNMSYARTGFIVDGDVKNMRLITTSNKEKLLIVTVNDAKVRAFTIKSFL